MENQSSPISEPVSSPVSASVPAQQNNSNWLILLFSVLVLLLLASTGYLYYQNQQLKNILTSYQTQPAISPTPVSYQSPSPSATTDATANWKTYTNNQAGFELRYPMDKFKLTENPTKLVSIVLPPEGDNWLYIDISTDKLTEPVTVEDWVTNNWPNQDKSVRKDIKIDGLSAIIFDGGNIEPKSNKYMFIIKGNNIIQLSAHYLNFLMNQGGVKNPYYDQTKELWISDIDQILSTFKVTQ